MFSPLAASASVLAVIIASTSGSLDRFRPESPVSQHRIIASVREDEHDQAGAGETIPGISVNGQSTNMNQELIRDGYLPLHSKPMGYYDVLTPRNRPTEPEETSTVRSVPVRKAVGWRLVPLRVR